MMPGVQIEDIFRALKDAFNKTDFARLVRFRLGEQLANIVNVDASFEDVVFETIEHYEQLGREWALVQAAYGERPNHPLVAAVYQKYGMATGVSVQQAGTPVAGALSQVTNPGFERKVVERLPFVDMNKFRERMTLVEHAVCRILVNDRPLGTGFLVAADAVLTNYHVLESVIKGETAAASVTCEFDYKVLADGSRHVGAATKLHATDWHIDSSPYSEAERNNKPDEKLPTVDELDYALVRLATPAGSQGLAGGAADSQPRGWIPMPDPAPSIDVHMPVLIAQHPDGKPLKLALDTDGVISVNVNGTRVRYATNTEGGSSGSPCFTVDWDLLALHHYGDPAFGHRPLFNQGIPIPVILQRLQRRGKADALGAQVAP